MKTTYLTILVLFISMSGFAQKNEIEINQNRSSFEVKLGYSQHSLRGIDINKVALHDDIASINKPAISISMTNTVSKFIWLKHEVSYLNKGATVTLMQNDINQEYKSDLTLSYLEIMPISPTISFHGFQVYAGPYVSTLLQSSIQRMDAKGNVYKDKSIYGDAKQEGDYLQKSDYGYALGLEYRSSVGIVAGLRFSEGLNNLFEEAENQDKQWAIKNKGFLIQLGYSF